MAILKSKFIKNNKPINNLTYLQNGKDPKQKQAEKGKFEELIRYIFIYFFLINLPKV